MIHPLAKMLAVILTCTLSVVLTVGASRLSAQASSKRLVHVTVTEPYHRFVTGLDKDGFEVVENGVRRAITEFSSPASPLSLAIVSDEPMTEVSAFKGSADELIQSRSLPDALRQLSASKNFRKVLVITTSADTQAIPRGIEVFETSPDHLLKTVVEIRNQYLLQFDSSTPSAAVEIILKQPRGLPVLQANYK